VTLGVALDGCLVGSVCVCVCVCVGSTVPSPQAKGWQPFEGGYPQSGWAAVEWVGLRREGP
jgi:hypothetical protein